MKGQIAAHIHNTHYIFCIQIHIFQILVYKNSGENKLLQKVNSRTCYESKLLLKYIYILSLFKISTIS